MQVERGNEIWRKVLKSVINNTPAKLKEIAQVTRVSELTLRRWMSGESTPRTHNVISLLDALPEHRSSLLNALLVDFPDLEKYVQVAQTSTELSKVFAAQVFDCVQTASDQTRFWSICQLVLRQALVQLDPMQSTGLDIRVMQCMKPLHGSAIRSLRERVGIGTVDWRGITLQSKQIFVGAESLAGYAVTHLHETVSQNLQEERTIPCQQIESEMSSAAYPLLKGGRVAGCLLVSSTQTNFFTSANLEHIRLFAGFLLLAFDDHEFYEREHIKLRMMPPYKEQLHAFNEFQTRIAYMLSETTGTQTTLTSDQAELRVLQQVEEDLLAQ